MSREDIAKDVAAFHGWKSFGTGPELDAYVHVIEQYAKREKVRETWFRMLNLNDRLGNATHREQALLAEIERMKRERKFVYHAYCDYRAKERYGTVQRA